MTMLDAPRRSSVPRGARLPSSALPGVSVLDRSVLGTGTATCPTEIDVLVEEIASLRPLPPIAAQVLQSEKPCFSAHALQQAISSDPALTTCLLQVVNSTCYGFPRRLTSVQEAFAMLGASQVRSIALTVAMMRALPKPRSVEPNAFWRHSLVVAMLARLAARAEGTPQGEAFAAGILHNIGRLALDHGRPHEFWRALNLAMSDSSPLLDAEERIFGFTDSEVGAALARRWKLAPDFAAVIEEQESELSSLVARARAYAREHGVYDGVVPASCSRRRARSIRKDSAAQTTEASDAALERLVLEQGGMDALVARASTLVEHALGCC